MQNVNVYKLSEYQIISVDLFAIKTYPTVSKLLPCLMF